MSKKITALYERSATYDCESIRRQRNNLETYAQAHGFENLQHYADCGYSAFDDMRPGFSIMMGAIDADKVGTVIVRDAARLSRNMDTMTQLTKEMQEHGVRIIMLNEKIDLLPPHIHDDENGLDYTLHGDYYLPDLIDQEQADHRPLGKWGMMRMDYLKKHRPLQYELLLLSGELHTHLADLDEQARDRHELVVKQMAHAEGITEQLKMRDQMTWVGMMNNISSAADEIIMSELIYC